MEAAGGEVIEDSDCFRVLGVLSTSRSIGIYITYYIIFAYLNNIFSSFLRINGVIEPRQVIYNVKPFFNPYNFR